MFATKTYQRGAPDRVRDHTADRAVICDAAQYERLKVQAEVSERVFEVGTAWQSGTQVDRPQCGPIADRRCWLRWSRPVRMVSDGSVECNQREVRIEPTFRTFSA